MEQYMSQAAPITPPKPKRHRYWLWSLLVLFVVLAVWFFYPRHYRIRDLVAHLDKAEPGWRYDDLRLKTPAQPEEQNVVPFLKSLEGELPVSLGGNSIEMTSFKISSPAIEYRLINELINLEKLPSEQVELLYNTRTLRSQLHKLLNYPNAYFLLPTWDDSMFRNVNNRPKLDEWWTLLTLHWEEGLRSTDTKDFENRTRLLWHHLLKHQVPLHFLHMTDQCLHYTILAMERAMAHHRFSDAFLKALEEQLAQIDFAVLVEKQLEMHRATGYQQVEFILDRWDEITQQAGFKNIRWYERLYFAMVRDNYIEGGTLFFEYVQARLQQLRAKATESEAATAIRTKLQLFARSSSTPVWVDALRRFKNPGMEQALFQVQQLDILQASIQSREAQVKLLRVALAIERSRLASGKLPASWSDVVPRYLPAIPADPMDPTRQIQLIPINEGIKFQATYASFHLLRRK
jgi:hypothetical protein